MTKAELIVKMARDARISKGAAERVLNSFLGTIKVSLERGESITLVGFGSFSVAKRKARTGKNPQTGQVIYTPARKVPVFKPGKGLRTSIR